MGYREVAEVFYPVEKMRRERLEDEMHMARRKVLQLRRWLLSINPDLPDPCDGTAWHIYEERWDGEV